MSHSLTPLIRDVVPPSLRRVANRVLGRSIRYVGPFPDWQSAVARTIGYQDPSILERVEAATRAVVSGTGHYEQDGVVFPSPAKPNAALAALMLAAAMEDHLAVLDFGGALGSHFLRWKPFLDRLPGTQWHVVEQPGYVARGRAMHSLSGLPIHFHERIADVGVAVNVAIASSVLQYLESPASVLLAIMTAAPRAIILDRTPFSLEDREYIMTQRVPGDRGPASYPIRLLSWPSVSEQLSEKYTLLCSFPCDDEPVRGRHAASYRGAIWLRRD